MSERCGRPTRKGTPCRLTLNGGRCPTHDGNLSARNAKVRASFALNQPEAYAAHQIRAGKAGYQAAGAKVGWAKAIEKARQWRLGHPSEPERWAIAVLGAAGLNHYQREYSVLDGTYSVDFAWPETKHAVEIDGHPSRASESEQAARAERTARKLAALTADGWQLLVIDTTCDREAGAGRLVEFARGCQPHDATDGFVWSF